MNDIDKKNSFELLINLTKFISAWWYKNWLRPSIFFVLGMTVIFMLVSRKTPNVDGFIYIAFHIIFLPFLVCVFNLVCLILQSIFVFPVWIFHKIFDK